MKRAWIVGACLAAPVVAPGAAAGTGPPPPITLTEAGADGQRHPFARWTPDYPIVNILVSSQPGQRRGHPAVAPLLGPTGSYGFLDHGPEPFWRGNDRLIPGVYYTAIDGDAPFQGEFAVDRLHPLPRQAASRGVDGPDLPEALYPLDAPSRRGAAGGVVLVFARSEELLGAQLVRAASPGARRRGRQVFRPLRECVGPAAAERRRHQHQRAGRGGFAHGVLTGSRTCTRGAAGQGALPGRHDGGNHGLEPAEH